MIHPGMTENVVCFLQNQWVKNPQKLKQIFERNPERREALIEAFLFMGCRTGKVLKATFGQQLCRRIIWEESSRHIAGSPDDVFPPDPHHMFDVIIKHRPRIIIALGAIAAKGLDKVVEMDKFENHPEPLSFDLFTGPHPTSRRNPVPRLVDIREKITSLEASWNG